jgi:serine/threonine protein kinase
MATGFGSIGKFQVLGTLGTGAHSTILHIRRNKDSKQYALKVVPIAGGEDQKFVEQARHEFDVAQLLDHPNLIKVFAMETVRDLLLRPTNLHLLTEYVNGKTLDTCPALPIRRLIQVFVQIASGMVQMHRRGVYHADLKPNNIIYSRTGDVKIIDFGLAWTKGEHKGRVQGTPEYMAPEQAKNGIVNDRTDIYNFGATMYRLVTLRHPPSTVRCNNDIPLDAKTRARLLKPVHECNAQAPPQLCELIEQCLQTDPHRRPERVSEIHGTLDHLADELGEAFGEGEDLIEW